MPAGDLETTDRLARGGGISAGSSAIRALSNSGIFLDRTNDTIDRLRASKRAAMIFSPTAQSIGARARGASLLKLQAATDALETVAQLPARNVLDDL